MRLRPARKDEAAALSALGLRSKAYWGYDAAFIEACREELAVEPTALADAEQCWRVAVDDDDRPLGYYGLAPTEDGDTLELEALFVSPDAIGTGIGRRLTDDARRAARSLGRRRIIIQGDPHAADFYLAVGAVAIGERESGSIPGRFLPLFELDCTAAV